MRRAKRCNEDCFCCPYPDCIIGANPRAYDPDYYRLHRERIQQTQKKYYEKNREKILAYQHEYYKENREKIAAQHRAYYKAHREEILARAREKRRVQYAGE